MFPPHDAGHALYTQSRLTRWGHLPCTQPRRERNSQKKDAGDLHVYCKRGHLIRSLGIMALGV